MKTALIDSRALYLFAVVASVAIGCSSGDDSSPSNPATGGSGGSAGSSAQAGHAGMNSAGTSSSSAGTSSNAGSAGVAGTTGNGGASGSAGTAGTAGTAGSEAGGASGAGGNAGTTNGGASGSAGTAGTAGTGGNAGAAGTTSGGASGSAGTAGTGGDAGTAGSAGTGGSAGSAGTTSGGASGSAGSESGGSAGTGGTDVGGSAGSGGASGSAGSGGSDTGGTAGSAGSGGGAAGSGGSGGSGGGGNPFVYFVTQSSASPVPTATLTSGTFSVSSTFSASGNGFKYQASTGDYYGTNSNGFIAFPTTMSGDFSIVADITVTAENKPNNASGIGIGMTTGFLGTDRYAYLVMRNAATGTTPTPDVIDMIYVSGATATTSSSSPGVAFTDNTAVELSFSRAAGVVTYGTGTPGGTLTPGTFQTTTFTDGTTDYGAGAVYPALSFNNVTATITKLVITDGAGTTVFDSATGSLVPFTP